MVITELLEECVCLPNFSNSMPLLLDVQHINRTLVYLEFMYILIVSSVSILVAECVLIVIRNCTGTLRTSFEPAMKSDQQPNVRDLLSHVLF